LLSYAKGQIRAAEGEMTSVYEKQAAAQGQWRYDKEITRWKSENANGFSQVEKKKKNSAPAVLIPQHTQCDHMHTHNHITTCSTHPQYIKTAYSYSLPTTATEIYVLITY